jgi:hypothetical protein
VRLYEGEVKVRVRRNIDGVEIVATRTGDVIAVLSREGWDDLVRAVLNIEGRAEDERLRDALNVAADDLLKAANQCAGLFAQARAAEGIDPLAVESESARRFTEKAERARAAASTGEQESRPFLCGTCKNREGAVCDFCGNGLPPGRYPLRDTTAPAGEDG